MITTSCTVRPTKSSFWSPSASWEGKDTLSACEDDGRLAEQRRPLLYGN